MIEKLPNELFTEHTDSLRLIAIKINELCDVVNEPNMPPDCHDEGCCTPGDFCGMCDAEFTPKEKAIGWHECKNKPSVCDVCKEKDTPEKIVISCDHKPSDPVGDLNNGFAVNSAKDPTIFNKPIDEAEEYNRGYREGIAMAKVFVKGFDTSTEVNKPIRTKEEIIDKFMEEMRNTGWTSYGREMLFRSLLQEYALLCVPKNPPKNYDDQYYEGYRHCRGKMLKDIHNPQ